jgi:hypothetical protein
MKGKNDIRIKRKIGAVIVLGIFTALMLAQPIAADDPWDWRQDGNTLPSEKYLGTNSNHDLPIRTYGNEVVRITTAGKVGIGTPIPSERLHVAGNILVSDAGDVTIKEGWVYGSQGDLNLFMDYDIGFIRVDKDSSGGERGKLLIEVDKVGIGTTLPGTAYKLDVEGDVHASGYFIAGTGTTYGDGYIALSPGLRYLNTDSGTLFIDGLNDRVGIGKTNPGKTLDVNGAIRGTTLNSGLGDYELYAMDQNVQTSDFVQFSGVNVGGAYNADTGEVVAGLSDAGSYSLQGVTAYTSDYGLFLGGVHVGGTGDPGDDNLIVDGNVGIGTTSPDKKLEILDDDYQLRLTYTGSYYTDFQTTSSGHLYIKPNVGNVGIGNNHPDARLEVWGRGHTSATTALDISDDGGHALLFVRDDGNVGIGTNDPKTDLHIDGDGVLGFKYRTNHPSGSSGTCKLYIKKVSYPLHNVYELHLMSSEGNEEVIGDVSDWF